MRILDSEVDIGLLAFNDELNKQLNQLGFFERGLQNTNLGKIWLEILDYFFVLLIESFKYFYILRKEAQNWKNEPKEMTPAISLLLKKKFKDRLEDGSTVSNGHADHWVDKIPIDDKLLRDSKSDDIYKVIEELYKKHRDQIMREAGECGYGFICIMDIRDKIKKNIITASPLNKCFRIFYEDGFWIGLFIFQAFTKTPSVVKLS